MQCDRFREAISARIDGEDPGLPAAAIDVHLAGCADCRAWQQRAHAVTRRARLGGSFLDRDLTAQVLAAAPVPVRRRRRRFTQRAALGVVAVAQLAITVPLLILGHDHDAGTHAAHELGSFDLALAIAFAVGAIRPALSAGLAWPCAIAASGLCGTAVIDWIGGQTPGADEAQHLIAVVGALLLLWQVRTNAGQSAGATADAFPGEETVRSAASASASASVAAGRDVVIPAEGSPCGGEAASAPVPSIAARTVERAPLPAGHDDRARPSGEDSAEAVA
jgi:predicted anti-sigma-YlaC factor YlaD